MAEKEYLQCVISWLTAGSREPDFYDAVVRLDVPGALTALVDNGNGLVDIFPVVASKRTDVSYEVVGEGATFRWDRSLIELDEKLRSMTAFEYLLSIVNTESDNAEGWVIPA